jgi:AcrR family transcriptional regulator
MAADSTETRGRILRAATKVFAERSYGSVTTREIAAQADVCLALLHYHFGQKEELYRAIWAKHYEDVTRVRHERLAAVDFDRPVETVVREITETFYGPPFAVLKNNEGRWFGYVMAREMADPGESSRGVLKRFVDPTASKFLKAYERALPELSKSQRSWCYQFMVGAILHALTDAGRLARISEGAAKSKDAAAAVPMLVDFAVAGWLSMRKSVVARRRSNGKS